MKLRSWLVWFTLCVAAVVVCVAYVDRPVAEFLDAHVRQTRYWNWIDLAVRPLDLVVGAAMLFFLGCGLWQASGRKLARWAGTPLRCACSATWAVAVTIILKHLFGRGWVDPSYTRDHLYGFHFLHGGMRLESFPSGTALIATAIVAVLWRTTPRLRWVGAGVVAILSAAVVIANFHWLSDVIAGVFLGTVVGTCTLSLLPSFGDERRD